MTTASLGPLPTHAAVPARSAIAIEDCAELSLDRLPDRDLDQTELVRLAATVARDDHSWVEQVDHSGGERHFVSLHRDAHVDVWLICWSPDNDTGWHDHDISSGSVAVVRGALVEGNLAMGGDDLRTEIGSGRVFSFGPDHIHRLTGRASASVSVHAYSPPLWRMGRYAVDAGGVLRRTSVSYADELRPLEAP